MKRKFTALFMLIVCCSLIVSGCAKKDSVPQAEPSPTQTIVQDPVPTQTTTPAPSPEPSPVASQESVQYTSEYLQSLLTSTPAAAQGDMPALLECVTIHTSRDYLDETLGAARIQRTLNNQAVFTVYQLDGANVHCIFEQDSLSAFAVVVSEEGVYNVPSTHHMESAALLSFTYYDYCPYLNRAYGNMSNGSTGFYAEYHDDCDTADSSIVFLGVYEPADTQNAPFKPLHTYMDIYRSETPDDYTALEPIRCESYPNVFMMVDTKYVQSAQDHFQVIGDLLGLTDDEKIALYY